jgi:oxygen-independent coproporphyrinogen-3 oxidase
MGYQAIGMDHFAKPNDSLAVAANKGVLSRNFQGYTCDQNDQILGLGVSAISNISHIRAQNAVDLKRYYQQVTTESLRHKGRQLTQDDLIRGDLINQLMCNYTINLAAISQRWSIDADKYFAHEIDSLAFYSSLGIVTKHQQQYSISTQHKPLVRVIAQLFDQYKKDQTRFSSVI